ncbi:MAG TPA: asparaginase [Polyangiaceae bacterium]|nr:asparaginase [Polyangiaceae bacterium]
MKRLLFLLTGGTLLMKEKASASGRSPSLLSLEDATTDLLAEVPALGRVATIETRQLFAMDSSDMHPSDWVALAREVHGAIAGAAEPRYDGVVVVHGTDTMAYTASALGLLLGPLPKPVVLTGSQRPLAEARTDARENLVDAALVATLDVPEVCVTFASRVLRGVRSTKRDAWALDAFASPNCEPLVELGVHAAVADHVRKPAPLGAFDDRIEPSVLAVRVFPGLEERLVTGAVRAGVKGLVLEAYGTGNVPQQVGRSLIPAIEHARAANVPVVIVSQCLRGFVDLTRYAGGAAAEKAGAISGGDMTPEAAVAKLMIGLGRYGSGDAMRDWFTKSVVGERAATAP